MSLNANEEILAGNADASFPVANPDATLFETVYADTDIDLCIRIMSLYCMCH